MKYINKQLGNIEDYAIHNEWLREFNEQVDNLITKNVMFSSVLPIEKMMMDKRILNPEWLDALRTAWIRGYRLHVLIELQNLFADKSKYVANIKPQII